MKKRIFIGILAAQDIGYKVAKWQAKHKNLSSIAGFRWIKPKNLHITLIPPFYANFNELKPLFQFTESALKAFKPFKAQFDKIMFGPSGKTARLIWAEGQTPEEFIVLKGGLEQVLINFIRPENRAPKLHLTIARFRPSSESDLPRLSEKSEKIDWSFEIKEIAIFESVLKKTGAEYIPLKIFKLG